MFCGKIQERCTDAGPPEPGRSGSRNDREYLGAHKRRDSSVIAELNASLAVAGAVKDLLTYRFANRFSRAPSDDRTRSVGKTAALLHFKVEKRVLTGIDGRIITAQLLPQ